MPSSPWTQAVLELTGCSWPHWATNRICCCCFQFYFWFSIIEEKSANKNSFSYGSSTCRTPEGCSEGRMCATCPLGTVSRVTSPSATASYPLLPGISIDAVFQLYSYSQPVVALRREEAIGGHHFFTDVQWSPRWEGLALKSAASA